MKTEQKKKFIKFKVTTKKNKIIAEKEKNKKNRENKKGEWRCECFGLLLNC